MKIKTAVIMVAILCASVIVFAACDNQVQNSAGEAPSQAANAILQQSAQSVFMDESTITVNTSESVKVAPDLASVYLGVRTEGTTAEKAQQENAKLAKTFTDAVKKEGVDEKDIETSNINIYQDYEDPNKYIMESSYKVTIRDMDKVGAVIDAAVSAGANTSYSLSFDISNRDEVYIEALGKAMQSVNSKAEAVAKSGGYTIVRPLSINEGGSSSYYNDMPVMESAAADTAGGIGTVVSPGDIEVSASVTGTYVIQ